MATSQNGYTAPAPRTRSFVIPASTGPIKLTIRDGAVGFVLACFALWYAEKVEPLAGKVMDDWGPAWRAIRGNETGLSNHASATAVDLNATSHPLGVRGTVTAIQRTKIAARLVFMRGVIRSGIFYTHRADEMHYEINASVERVVSLARFLLTTPRGRRVLAANGMSAAQAIVGVPA